MPFAHRPDARIWRDQSGTGDPILLIMGHAYRADMWHRTAPELAASYRVIRFDNRGVGRSSDPPGPYSVQLMAEDALAVLDAASAASAHVYGVSLGGAIALQLALDHPGRVRSLILGCTAASAEGASRCVLLTRVRSLLPAAALNRMAWMLLYGPDTPVGRRAEDQQIVRRTRSSGRGRRGQLTGAAGFDVTGGLEEIRIPTLVMHGARTASSPLPTLSASLTASPEPGSSCSRTPVTLTSPTSPKPPTRRSCTSSPAFPAQPTVERRAPSNQHGGYVSGVTRPLVGSGMGPSAAEPNPGSGRSWVFPARLFRSARTGCSRRSRSRHGTANVTGPRTGRQRLRATTAPGEEHDMSNAGGNTFLVCSPAAGGNRSGPARADLRGRDVDPGRVRGAGGAPGRAVRRPRGGGGLDGHHRPAQLDRVRGEHVRGLGAGGGAAADLPPAPAPRTLRHHGPGQPVTGRGGAAAEAGAWPTLESVPEQLPAGSFTPGVSPVWKLVTSGGSTGRPKLIAAAAPALLESVAASRRWWACRPAGASWCPGRSSHNAPFVATAAGMLLGNHLVVMPRFDAAADAALVEQYRVNWLYLVPTMMLRIWRLPEEVRLAADLSSLEVAFHVAAPCPAWLKQAWIDWLGPQKVLELYGGTEVQASHRDHRDRMAGPPRLGRPAGARRDGNTRRDGRPVPAGRTGRSGCAGAPAPRPRTSTSAPQPAAPPTAGNPWATSATSTPTGTSTSPTG